MEASSFHVDSEDLFVLVHHVRGLPEICVPVSNVLEQVLPINLIALFMCTFDIPVVAVSETPKRLTGYDGIRTGIAVSSTCGSTQEYVNYVRIYDSKHSSSPALLIVGTWCVRVPLSFQL